ncbi:hypothetical protein HUJ04_008548 [Dendroctonus ponderosae]|nr:hypothetical protein HUJ04_008548 [Dendroctonus ponderosae]
MRYDCGKEKQFVCNFPDCSYKAYQKVHLTRHAERHAPPWSEGLQEQEPPEPTRVPIRRPKGLGSERCICGKTYYEKKNLQRHQKLRCALLGFAAYSEYADLEDAPNFGITFIESDAKIQ